MRLKMNVLCGLVSAGLLAGHAGAQTQASADGSWSGALRCGQARVNARLDVRTVQGQIQATLQPTNIEGPLPPGASGLLAPIELIGNRMGEVITFTSIGKGGTFPNLKATLKDGGRILTGTLPPQTGCSSLYFTRQASAAQTVAPVITTGTDARVLTGVWQGRYVCEQGVTGVLLAIKGGADGQLQVRFSFYPLPENPFVPAGSLDAQFVRQGDQLVTLKSTWISRPQGFTFGVGGTLALSNDDTTLTIVPDGAAGCLKLEVERQP